MGPGRKLRCGRQRNDPQSRRDYQDDLDGFFDCEVLRAQALRLTDAYKKGAEVQLSGSLRQKTRKTNRDPPRKVSKIEIRVE